MDSHKPKLMRRVTWLAVCTASVLIVIKLFAYLFTGSVALLSSLVDSILDLFASTVNLVAVRIALQPPDQNHRFGHGKAEPLAGLFQAAFISGSAVFLLFEIMNRLINPRAIEQGEIGIVVMVISIALTIALVWYQRYVIAKTGSVAITADSLHYRSDVLVNAGVIVAILLDLGLGWSYADPLIALVIAIYILYCAWQIAVKAIDQLMDHELPDEERERIRCLVLENTRVLDVKELRTRASGLNQFIQLHLVLGPDLDLRTAHAIAIDVQTLLQQTYPEADIMIYQYPGEQKSAEC